MNLARTYNACVASIARMCVYARPFVCVRDNAFVFGSSPKAVLLQFGQNLRGYVFRLGLHSVCKSSVCVTAVKIYPRPSLPSCVIAVRLRVCFYLVIYNAVLAYASSVEVDATYFVANAP